MNRQWVINITGDEWQIVPVSAACAVYARKEGRQLMESYGVAGSDELFYRACVACRSIMSDGNQVFKNGEEVLHALTEREIYDITDENVRKGGEQEQNEAREKQETVRENEQREFKEIIKDSGEYTRADIKIRERTQEKAAENIQTQTGRKRAEGGQNVTGTYRDAVSALSRYLERDSRRFDG